MIKKLRNLLYILLTVLTSPSAFAIDSQLLPDVKPGIVSITIKEPTKRVGYTMSDIIEREVTLTIKAPYNLIESSLPIVGYEKRYRGKLIGVELKNMAHHKKEYDDYAVHNIKLAYQVFVSTVVAKNVGLGPEYLNLINTNNSKDVVKYRIPSISISVSPLAIFGQVKVEDNMSPLLGPLEMHHEKELQRLKLALIAGVLSLLGLLYILGQHAWLPRMGGNFAKTYRAIKKIPASEHALKLAISSLHQAFNQTAGMSIFNDNIELFLSQHKNFAPIKNEMYQFFRLSRHVFFEPSVAHDIGDNPQQWLLKFTRLCRDCERGLNPAPFKAGV